MTGQQEMFPRHVGYGGKKAAEIVGITYRQLDYWARTDLVRPSLVDAAGSGSRRKYSYQDLLELKVEKHGRAIGSGSKQLGQYSIARAHVLLV